MILSLIYPEYLPYIPVHLPSSTFEISWFRSVHYPKLNDRPDGFISPSKRLSRRRLRGVLSDRFKVITSTNKISMKFILVRCLEILFGFIQSNDRVITIKQKYTEFMTKKFILFCRLDCHYCKIFFSLFLLVLFSKKYIWDHKTVLE